MVTGGCGVGGVIGLDEDPGEAGVRSFFGLRERLAQLSISAVTCASCQENTPLHTSPTQQLRIPPSRLSTRRPNAPSSSSTFRQNNARELRSPKAPEEALCPLLMGRARSTLDSYLRLRDSHGLDSFSPHLRRSGYSHHDEEHGQSRKIKTFIASLNP